MSHVSRMMNMRLKAMEMNIQKFWILQNDLLDWEVTGQVSETTTRCDALTTFHMFDTTGMWSSDYKNLPGY